MCGFFVERVNILNKIVVPQCKIQISCDLFKMIMDSNIFNIHCILPFIFYSAIY